MRFYVGQIALALGDLHQRNIVYGNLKLDNVLLHGDGYISLKEFEHLAVLNKHENEE